jgi:hypothetical protein
MDLVTSNLMATFRAEQGFPDDLSEPTVFEHFANYCVGSREYPEDFDLDDVHVAGGNDLQLDGLLILVNGLLVNATDEIDDLLETNNHIDAEFIFIQAKTGRNFEGAEISNMFFGVRDLFAPRPTLPRNEALQLKEQIIKHVYTKSARFRRGLPALKMYYVTTGRWQDDQQLCSRIETEKRDVEQLDIFRSVQFTLVQNSILRTEGE